MFNWFKKPPKEEQAEDYNPSKDFYKSIREKQAKERKRYNKWKKELKEGKLSNTVTSGGYPGSLYSNGTYNTWTSGPATTVSSTSIADAKITIDGGENGSMRVDVPLVVNGRDVMKEIDEMRDALLLLKRDVDMEAKYPKLKALKDEYERALEKYTTFETIKESK